MYTRRAQGNTARGRERGDASHGSDKLIEIKGYLYTSRLNEIKTSECKITTVYYLGDRVSHVQTQRQVVQLGIILPLATQGQVKSSSHKYRRWFLLFC